MIRDAILEFSKQLIWEPDVEHAERLSRYTHAVVVGMGGSHLAADILSGWDMGTTVRVHSDYDLPRIPESQADDTLIIISSYSGNTEEALSAYDRARGAGLALCAISTGGLLLEKAEADGISYIRIPDTGIQPRLALGYSLIAILKALGSEDIIQEFRAFGEVCDSEAYEGEGRRIADAIKNKVPVIYASANNSALAYIWKIKFNEGSKIPAFMNVFPELNHNEMTGFDAVDATRGLSECMVFLFLADDDDDPKIKMRMDLTQDLFEEREFSVTRADVAGANRVEKAISSLLTADWTALFLAEQYGVDPEKVPMVEGLKQRMRE